MVQPDYKHHLLSSFLSLFSFLSASKILSLHLYLSNLTYSYLFQLNSTWGCVWLKKKKVHVKQTPQSIDRLSIALQWLQKAPLALSFHWQQDETEVCQWQTAQWLFIDCCWKQQGCRRRQFLPLFGLLRGLLVDFNWFMAFVTIQLDGLITMGQIMEIIDSCSNLTSKIKTNLFLISKNS